MVGRQEKSSPSDKGTGFWRAVCGENRKHGSEGGIGKHNPVVRLTPTLRSEAAGEEAYLRYA